MQSLLQLAEMLTKHIMNIFMISGYYYTVDLKYCSITALLVPYWSISHNCGRECALWVFHDCCSWAKTI